MTHTAFITGSNSGVGLATTKLFLNKGWNVVATARDTSSPSLLELAGDSNNLLIQVLDLTKPDSFQPAINEAVDRFGKIDVLINNAGYAQYGLLEDLPIDAIRQNFEVNVFGTLGLIKAFLPHLRSTIHGMTPARLIYVGSGGAHFGLPLLGPYGASKAAMNNFLESLMYELEGVDPPIKVKIVCPHGGITETNFGQTSMQLAGFDHLTPELHMQYGPFIQRAMQKFSAMQTQSMSARDAAEVIFTAATDDTTKLRYFVGPRDGGKNLKRRMQGGQPGEDLDDIDYRYIEAMRESFM